MYTVTDEHSRPVSAISRKSLGDPTMNSPKLLELMAQINEAVLSVESGPALMAYAGAGVPFVTGGPDAARAIAARASVILVAPDTARHGTSQPSVHHGNVCRHDRI
jgi:hypothetical protein